MLAMLAVRVTSLVVLATLVATAMWAWRRVAQNPFFLPHSRQGRKVGRLRMVAGLLGLLIVVSMGLTTWHTVRQIYALAPVEVNPDIHAPTLPTINESLEPNLSKARLLVTAVVLNYGLPRSIPVSVVQTQLDWPAQKQATFLHIPATPLSYTIDVTKLGMSAKSNTRSQIASDTSQSDLELTIDYSTRVIRTGHVGTRSESRMSFSIPAGQFGESWSDDGPRPGNPLMLTEPYWHKFSIVTMVTAIRPDDPLKTIPLKDYPPLPAFVHTGWTGALWYVEAGPIGLVAYLRMSTLLLLAAAVLLALPFRRRDLALVGTLLAVFFFVIATDRAMVAYDIAWLKDPAASVARRNIALTRLTNTFFYGHTASRAFEAPQQ